MANPITQVEIDYIPWARAQGHSLEQIAEHLDRHWHTIRRYASGERTGKPKRPCKYSAEQQAEVRRQVASIGYHRASLALGLPLSTVRNIADRAGVSSPYKQGCRPPSGS